MSDVVARKQSLLADSRKLAELRTLAAKLLMHYLKKDTMILGMHRLGTLTEVEMMRVKELLKGTYYLENPERSCSDEFYPSLSQALGWASSHPYKGNMFRAKELRNIL